MNHTLTQLEEERKRLEARLAFVNVRCPARDRILDRLVQVNAEIAQKGAQSA